MVYVGQQRWSMSVKGLGLGLGYPNLDQVIGLGHPITSTDQKFVATLVNIYYLCRSNDCSYSNQHGLFLSAKGSYQHYSDLN